MKAVLNSRLFKNYSIILVFTFIIEILFRLLSNIDVFDVSLIRIFIGLNIVSIILSYLFSWLSVKLAKVATAITILLVSIYGFFQMGFNNFIGVYASVNTSSQLGAVTAYIKDFFASFLGRYYLIFLPFIFLVIGFIFIKGKNLENEKKFKLKEHNKKNELIKSVSCASLILVFSFCYQVSLTIGFMQNDLQTVSNKDLFKYPSVPSIVINQFGFLGFGFLDVLSLNKEAPSNTFVLAQQEKNKIVSREVDNTLLDEVIKTEEDETYKNIAEYLKDSKVTDYNDYTGMFEGKNLIVIMMESVNEIIINKDLYPNFYKLYSEGISFTNNYSPRNSCATGNNEFSGMTSLYTIQNNCTANIYRSNTYFTSIFNLFKNAGYETSSMHNYTENYYYRSMIHKNLGSEKYYGVQDLGIEYYNEYKNWSSDEDFMEVASNIILNSSEDKPFMTWLTTVSSHQPYKVSSVEGDKYLSITDNTNYPMDLRRYMSKLKTLDNSLGILINNLKQANKLDDTVIVLYGDHYPYGLKNETISNVITHDLEEYEVEKTPMVIYNSTIKHEVINKYSSYINLTPTIANLFNLNYDPRLYMGTDVFSDDYLNLVVFADGSWKNDIAYYDASSAKIKYYKDEEYTSDEILNINNIVQSKMQISASIIQNNYYNYLQEKLKSIEEEKEVLANMGG